MSGKIEIKSLISKLNASCKMCLEEAAGICVTQNHREVTIEHFLVCLLRQSGNDIRILCQNQNVNPDDLQQSIEASLNRMRQNTVSQSPVFSPMLVELLQDAWMVSSIELSQTKLRSGTIFLSLVKDADRYANYDSLQYLEKISSRQMLSNFEKLLEGSIESENSTGSNQDKNNAIKDRPTERYLDKYAQNFTQDAKDGKIDPVFCRDSEIRQITEILCRRRKNNPICVGDAGVGKTAVVEGLALRIVQGNVPQALLGMELWGLDMGALQAGASVKGEFEKRLKNIIEEVKNSEVPIILFIDEAHTLVGAGAQQGAGDAANLLKPALARGELKTIAATTWSEYKKYFEKDPALTRRFQLVKLDEPTIEEAQIILRGIADIYSQIHNVYITEKAIEAAAKLSARYITGRQLPDKAIDVLDTACARVKATMNSNPVLLEELSLSRQALENEKAGLKKDIQVGLENNETHERIKHLEEKIIALELKTKPLKVSYDAQLNIAEQFRQQRSEIIKVSKDSQHETDIDPIIAEAENAALSSSLKSLRSELNLSQKDNQLVSIEVGQEEIASVISDWTGVPATSMAQDDFEILLNLSKNMGDTIKGQDHALKIIEDRLRASRLDLHQKSQPLGVFLFAGPSGIGKTETALEVARQLFGGEQFVTTINMSEYQERHTISRLIGSPPGYVGYGEGGILTEAIRKKPYSVVLLDEVEKADVNVLNLFYQAFDKGVLADGEGREIDCKNIVFFLTSNLGTEQIEQWLNVAEGDKQPSPEQISNSLKPIFSEHFKPALLARMTPIAFMPLSAEIMGEIVERKLADLATTLINNQNIELSVKEKAISFIKEKCLKTPNGARLIDQVIQRQIIPPISLEILEAGLVDDKITGVEINVMKDGGLSFAFKMQEKKSSQKGKVSKSTTKPKATSKTQKKKTGTS